MLIFPNTVDEATARYSGGPIEIGVKLVRVFSKRPKVDIVAAMHRYHYFDGATDFDTA